MQPTYYVKDMDTLRIMADTMRGQILEFLVKEALNARQIAQKLGIQASKIYYHLGLLEKLGLIEVVETSQVGNLIEKTYRAVAEDYQIDPALISFRNRQGKNNLASLVDTTLDAVRADLQHSLQARFKELEDGAPQELRKVMIARTMSKLSDEDARRFIERLEALMEEFRGMNLAAEGQDSDQTYSLTILFNPTFYIPPEDEDCPSAE